jgi:hypothetical protein
VPVKIVAFWNVTSCRLVGRYQRNVLPPSSHHRRGPSHSKNQSLSCTPFEVLAAVLLRVQVLWDVVPCLRVMVPDFSKELSSFVFRGQRRELRDLRRWSHHVVWRRRKPHTQELSVWFLTTWSLPDRCSSAQLDFYTENLIVMAAPHRLGIFLRISYNTSGIVIMVLAKACT